MKKVLALVLVATLAIAMGVSGFAAVDLTDIKGFDSGKTLADGVDLPSGATRSNQVIDLGDRYAMDKLNMKINLTTSLFGAGPVAQAQTVYYVLDSSAFLKSGYVFTTVQAGTVSNWNQVKDKLEAASPTQINTTNVADITDWMMPDTTTASDYTDLLQRYKSAGLAKQVTASTGAGLYFTDQYDKPISEQAVVSVDRNLTADEIRRSKITMSTTYKANSNTIKEIKLVNKDGRIEFKLAEEWVSTGSKDFEALVYLSFNGKRADNDGVTVMGTMKNPEIDVDANHDFVDISEGYVLNPIEFNSKVAVDLGNGVTVHTKLFKDRKMYGISTRDDDNAADRVFLQYKDVDNVLTLKTVGFGSTYNYVTLSTDYSGYYVYDENMSYLGRGDEQLSFSKKYYLANRMLDLADDEEEEFEYEPPVTGGDGSASSNANANPGTGR